MTTLLPSSLPDEDETGRLDRVRESLGRRGVRISARLASQGWTAMAYLSAVLLLGDWAVQQQTAFAGLDWLVSSAAPGAPGYHLAAVIDHALPMPAMELLGWLLVLVAVDTPGLMRQVHVGLRRSPGVVTDRVGVGPLAGLSWVAGLSADEAYEHVRSRTLDARVLQSLAALRGQRIPDWSLLPDPLSRWPGAPLAGAVP